MVKSSERIFRTVCMQNGERIFMAEQFLIIFGAFLFVGSLTLALSLSIHLSPVLFIYIQLFNNNMCFYFLSPHACIR